MGSIFGVEPLEEDDQQRMEKFVALTRAMGEGVNSSTQVTILEDGSRKGMVMRLNEKENKYELIPVSLISYFGVWAGYDRATNTIFIARI